MIRNLLTLALAFCFAGNQAFAAKEINIIPAPASIELQKGEFKIKGAAVNCDASFDEISRNAVRSFASSLNLCTGKKSSYAEPVGLKNSAANGAVKGVVFVRDTALGAEEYNIVVSKSSLIVRAGTLNSVLYAIETIKQMLPLEIYSRTANENADWNIPCCTIQDSPRYAYRGLMLDSCRHFWSVEEVKKFLDIMLVYKLNRFHWHLSEDQGWRIQIDAYPLLTQVGAYRNGTMIGKDFDSNDGIRYGGYYTKDQIRDVVSYAAARGITIVPEIDMPGHMQAALASYPELGCTGGPYEVRTKWGISKQVLNPAKEEVFTFLQAVLKEVTELFPSEYIHIGGDECPKDEWKANAECQALIAELGLKDDENGTAEQHLQCYVTKRLQDYVATLGRKVIGWDEILEGELAPGATIMSWRGTKGGIKGAQKGFDVIMSPNKFCYLDYYQSENKDKEPLSIGGFLPIEKCYSLEPEEGLDSEQAQHIKGVQANLWTEYIAEPEHLEYMLLPRLLAISEVQWCQPEGKNYERFIKSVKSRHDVLLDALGYNHRKID